METRTVSRFFEKIENPKIYDFEHHLGKEVIIGLEGKDQFGNREVRYVNGIVARDRTDGTLGLYEITDGQGVGIANRVIPVNTKSPIVELIRPSSIDQMEKDFSKKDRIDIKIRENPESHNPNSQVRYSYQFKSK